MKYSEVYCWPNMEDPKQRAEQFFSKVKNSINKLRINFDTAFTLCYDKRNPDNLLVHVFVDSSKPYDDSGELYKELDAFFENCGCCYQCIESLSLGNISINNLASALENTGIISIVEGPFISRAR